MMIVSEGDLFEIQSRGTRDANAEACDRVNTTQTKTRHINCANLSSLVLEKQLQNRDVERREKRSGPTQLSGVASIFVG